MQRFSENCCIFGIRHAVSSKAQGTVKDRTFKKVRNLNSTRILISNPGCTGGALEHAPAELAREADPDEEGQVPALAHGHRRR